jgi:hypothetical protein
LVGTEFQETLTSIRVHSHKKMAAISGGHLKIDHRVEEKQRPISVLGRPGSDLLFQALRLSTIGAGEFNGRVRDGIGFSLSAKTTRPAKNVQGSEFSDRKITETSGLWKQTGFSQSIRTSDT